MLSFLPDTVADNGPIILYGAAMYGELAYNALCSIGKPVYAFCDRVQAGKSFCGYPVLAPEEVKKYPEAYILVCATKGFAGIVHYLESIGHTKYYEISDLLSYVQYEKLPPYCRALPINGLIEKYRFYLPEYALEASEQLHLSFVALSITERCTLRCKKCSVLVPYYMKPRDDAYCEVIQPFQRFLSCIESIAELQIGGGEPFVHRELREILAWCIQQEKIKEISIFTNSTILPDAELTDTIAHPKVKLLLDDYGSLSKRLPDLIRLCDAHHIRYLIQKFEHWDDLGDYQEKKETEDQVIEKFHYCSFGNVMSFMKGKLYRCTTAARIADLQMVEDDPTDYIDFNCEKNISCWRNDIIQLITDKKYHLGCRHCNGISTNRLGIPVAEQL